MLNPQQKQLFDTLARSHPGLREYLSEQLGEQHDRLTKLIDGEQLRVAQGHAQCLQNLIKLLDHARAPARG